MKTAATSFFYFYNPLTARVLIDGKSQIYPQVQMCAQIYFNTLYLFESQYYSCVNIVGHYKYPTFLELCPHNSLLLVLASQIFIKFCGVAAIHTCINIHVCTALPTRVHQQISINMFHHQMNQHKGNCNCHTDST